MSESGTIASAPSRRIARPSASHAGARFHYAVILAAALGAMLATAFQSYRAIDWELTHAALSKNAALAQLAAVTLSEKLDRLIDIGVPLADRVRFRQLVETGRWAEVIEILARVRDEFPFVDRVALNDVDSAHRAGNPHVPEVIGRNFADRDWYRGVSRAWKPYVSEVYRRTAIPALIDFGVAIPIRNNEGMVLGVLLLQVRLDTLFE